MKYVGLLLTVWCLCILAPVGCGNSDGDDTDPNADDTAANGKQSSLQAFSHDLTSRTTGEQWMELLDDAYVRPGRVSKPERWTIAFEISTARARLAYAKKINAEFGGLNGKPLPTDLGMASLHEALLDTELTNVRPRQAELHYTQDGQSKVLYLILAEGRWRLDSITFGDGQKLRVAEYQSREPRYRAVHHYHELVIKQIEDGEVATAEEAQAKLDELMSNPARYPRGFGNPIGMPDEDVLPRDEDL